LLKARSRKLSMILVLAMLMTMFAGLGTASAALVDYSAYGVTTVNTGNNFDKTLGSVLIEIDDIVYLGTYKNWVTLKMPSGVSLQTTPASVTTDTTTFPTGVDVAVKNASSVDIMIDPQDAAVIAAAGASGELKIPLYFKNVKVQSGSGNLDVTFIPQSGSLLQGGSVTIANIVSKGATQAVVTTVKSLPEGVHAIDTISIGELSPEVFKKAGTIKIELPKGVKWVTPAKDIAPADLAALPGTPLPANSVLVAGSWDYAVHNSALNSVLNLQTGGPATNYIELYTNSDDSILEVKITRSLATGNNLAGRIDLGGKGYNLKIDIDEDDAKKGDIVAKISSKDFDGLTKQNLTIAKYGDFETTVTENEVTEVIAGQSDQELGTFYIEETLAGSLVGNRTIVLQLPSGVKWTQEPTLTAEKGDITPDPSRESKSDNKIRYTLKNDSGSAGKILVEDGEVYVEPNFTGDIEIEVSGTAGAKGTVKVAEAIKAVDISVSKVPNIIIGEQNVATGDIIIKEAVAEAIQEGDIVIELAGGYEFYKEPTVKVTEGDLGIDDVDINNDDQLVITIDKESNDASTITISDVYVTGYRYAPTGPVVAKFVAAEVTKDDGATPAKATAAEGSTALDSLYDEFGTEDEAYSEKSVGEVTIANCVTPAEGSGVAEFKIGSNIYSVGGVAKVMDVAPYIKGDRTYVPMRYLGEMLGAEVVWDDAARTVTLTKGDTTVVFTIGSTTYTVNGESKTADVAPEIASDRTMLPARYVAEAFGAIVGWDAGTQTVVVQIAE